MALTRLNTSARHLTRGGAAVIAMVTALVSSDAIAGDLSDGRLAQRMLEDLVSSRVGASADVDVLSQSGASGLPASYPNIQKLSGILSSSRSVDQKKAAAKLLGQQYEKSRDFGIKNFARNSLLKSLEANENREVQEAIVLVYSRLDYFDDSLSVLSNAHRKNIIDDDRYYGDMAHLSVIAPAEARSIIFDKILKSENRFSAAIIASYASANPYFVDGNSVKLLEAILGKSEPVFDETRSSVGALQLAQYATWMKASANVSAVETGQPAMHYIEQQLMKDGQDPRKILAWIMDMSASEQNQLNSNPIFKRKLKDVISAERIKYPHNEFYSEAAARLK